MALPEPEWGPSGRWGGRLTRSALPLDDPSLDELSDDDRHALASVWQQRAAMERRVADSFDVIRTVLARQRAAPELVELAARAVDDEYRHAELSRLVATRFAGRELPAPTRLVLELPRHPGASAELRDTLFVVGQCVFNETTASAFLELCLSRARGALARSALRELLSDEIDHGRIGWTYLASLPLKKRAEIAPWLLSMAYLNLRTWREHSPLEALYRPPFERHGAPPACAVHDALLDALRVLIVPGLRELGVETAAIEAWIAAGAPTDAPPRALATRFA